MLYLILSQSSEAYAQAWSESLWKLSRPDYESTTLYCGWETHGDGRVALCLPEGDTQPVHENADVDAFKAGISSSVTEDEANEIAAIIEGRKGQRISIIEIIQASPSLSPNLKTTSEMKASGWLQTDTEI